MAGTITHALNAGQQVYVVVECPDDAPNSSSRSSTNALAVRKGTIIQIRTTVLITGTMLEYDVRILTQSGTVVLEEDQVFATLQDALVEYEARLS